MAPQADGVLESIIEITQERDKRSLESTLLKVLAEHLEFDAAFLLRAPVSIDPEELEIASYNCPGASDRKPYLRPRLNVPLDPLMRQAIAEKQVVVETDEESSRSIMPITINGRLHSLLMVYSDNDQLATDRLVQGFINIYSNFIAILSDQERDTLTGLLNRKAFDEQIADLLLANKDALAEPAPNQDRRSQTPGRLSWLAIIDIDHFKSINDNFGHLYGDEVLMIFANVMQNCFRKHDLLFRYGGEEFVVILSSAAEENTIKILERFREMLENETFPQVGRVTASIGFARLEPHIHPTLVVEQADKSLYYAKQNGRNQIANYNRLVEQGLLEKREFKSDIEMF